MTAGQPRLDIALRTKHWLWYWLVKCASHLSDDELDNQFAGSQRAEKRARMFYRYRSLGSSPADTRGYRKNGRSVFAAVHDQSDPDRVLYDPAKRVYESRLWELLTDRNVSVARCREIIEALCIELGLTRISSDEASLLRGLVGDPHVLSQLGHARPDVEALRHFRNSSDINVVALLSALYKVALANHELERAILLKEAAEYGVIHFIVKWRPPQFLEGLVWRLISDRVFGNAWLTEINWIADAGDSAPRNPRKNSDAARRREIRDFVHWYVSAGRKAGQRQPRDFGLPMLTTPALQWTRDNREALEAWRLAIGKDRGKVASLEDSPFESERELAMNLTAESKAMRETATRRLKALLDATPEGDLGRSPTNVSTAQAGSPPSARTSSSATVADALARIELEDARAVTEQQALRRTARRRVRGNAAG